MLTNCNEMVVLHKVDTVSEDLLDLLEKVVTSTRKKKRERQRCRCTKHFLSLFSRL